MVQRVISLRSDRITALNTHIDSPLNTPSFSPPGPKCWPASEADTTRNSRKMKHNDDSFETRNLLLEEEQCAIAEEPRSVTSGRLPTKINFLLAALYIPLLTAWVWLYFSHVSNLGPDTTSSFPQSGFACTKPDMLPSPARESGAVQWELRPYDVHIHNNNFSGPPRPELERAWHELISGGNIKVSGSDLEQVGLISLELADESGYVVLPSMFHELHCLKRIRRYTYFDHYYAGSDEASLVEERAHVDHCIELMRHTILCHADMSFSTYSYLEETSNFTATDVSLHQCTNTERLRTWMLGRKVDLLQQGILKGQGAS